VIAFSQCGYENSDSVSMSYDYASMQTRFITSSRMKYAYLTYTQCIQTYQEPQTISPEKYNEL
jgi:hypothetical protein